MLFPLNESATKIICLLAVAFAGCLAASLLTDSPEGEFVALMFAIQLAAFVLLPVAMSLSICISNYFRYCTYLHSTTILQSRN